MTRVPFAVLFVAMVCLANARARAELPVAPYPREVHPDGSRHPVPQSKAPATDENPAVTVERIIKNSKDVGDKLAQTDTGTDTRKTQGQILSDIDALINRQENPPPPPPDQNQNPMSNPDNGSKKDKPMDGMGGTGMGDPPMPKDGMGESPQGGRQPRMGDDKKEPGGSGSAGKHPDTGDADPKTGASSKGGQQGKGGMAGGNTKGKGAPKSALPFEMDLSKDVWGHLPDKLRQQMSQYYKEDFTPKYAELLRLYYSSLSDKPRK